LFVVIAAQPIGAVVLERINEFVQELERFAGALIREARWIDKHQSVKIH